MNDIGTTGTLGHVPNPLVGGILRPMGPPTYDVYGCDGSAKYHEHH